VERPDLGTWEAITSRRNVRKFAPAPIPDDDLDRILEAGRRAPSSRNEQRWDLVVCTDRAHLEALAQVWQGARHVAGAAAAIAIVAPRADDDATRQSIQYDLGQLTMVMMLAAAAMGIGTAHSAVMDQRLARELLGFPEDHFLAWLMSLGYPADRPLTPIVRPDRRPFDEVVHRERW
jgi:nitroreductase